MTQDLAGAWVLERGQRQQVWTEALTATDITRGFIRGKDSELARSLPDGLSAGQLAEALTVARQAGGGDPLSGAGRGSDRPVLPAQPGDPAELGCIRRDDCQPAPECLASDQKVVGADRRSGLLQGSAYPASGLSILVIEVQQIQVTGDQDAQALYILLNSAALLRAVPQFEQHDG